jgi:hypothetical protein
MYIVHFLYMVFSHLYLMIFYNHIYKKIQHILHKDVFSYYLNGYYHRLILYKTNAIKKTNTPVIHPKKYIFCISGSYILTFTPHINNLIHDLHFYAPDILRNYEVIAFEKKDKTSIMIYEDIIEYVNYLNKKCSGIDELILLGFSAGGIVASHIIARLGHIKCNKKLIMYDTPLQVMDNVVSLQNNMLMRWDFIFYNTVYNVYCNHYNFADFKHKIISKPSFDNATKLVELIKEVHNFDETTMYNLTSFNTNQHPDTMIINIACNNDPFVFKTSQTNFMQTHQQEMDKLNIININKPCIGHCSDMAFSTKYLNDIIYAISLKKPRPNK